MNDLDQLANAARSHFVRRLAQGPPAMTGGEWIARGFWISFGAAPLLAAAVAGGILIALEVVKAEVRSAVDDAVRQMDRRADNHLSGRLMMNPRFATDESR